MSSCKQPRTIIRPRTVLLGMSLGLAAGGALANELSEYADACNTELGTAVTAVDCMDGIELPMVGTEGGSCQKPAYLDGAGCHAGSRIGQQSGTPPNIGIVYLCRKKVSGLSQYQFDDIAVIQTDFDSGKTCFYQKFGVAVDGRTVPAPSSGLFWMQPTEMRDPGNACVQCHDSGPFIRTPYVMQAGLEALKNTHRNHNDYSFAGNAYVDWNGKVFQLRIDGDKNCSNACHVMGANLVDNTAGTSADFGLRSTGATVTDFLDDEYTHGDRAHWMKPGQKTKSPSPADMDAARQYAACAANFTAHGCIVTLWGGQSMAIRKERGKHPERLEESLR